MQWQGCEAMAAQIGRLVEVPERTNVPVSSLPSQRAQGMAAITRAEAVAELQRLPGAVRAALSDVIAHGTAFHHAGGMTLPACHVACCGTQSSEEDLVEVGRGGHRSAKGYLLCCLSCGRLHMLNWAALLAQARSEDRFMPTLAV